LLGTINPETGIGGGNLIEKPPFRYLFRKQGLGISLEAWEKKNHGKNR